MILIPQIDEDFLYDEEDIEEEQDPSLTFKLNEDTKRIETYIDDIEALKQWIYCLLRTKRNEYEIYSDEYGVELEALLGQDFEFACVEIEEEITDAISIDDRIESVEEFTFQKLGNNSLLVTFTVVSIFGNTEIETEVG